MTKFVENLKDLLEEQQLSAIDFAKHALIPYNCVYNWLNGTYSPSIKNLIKTADYFHCSIDFLIGTIPDDPPGVQFLAPPAFSERLFYFMKKNLSQSIVCAKIREYRAYNIITGEGT